jgi:hypothetical protein
MAAERLLPGHLTFSSDKVKLILISLCAVTPMLPQRIRDLWGDLPANNTHGVARALLIPMARPEINGRTVWVAGNKAIELEESLHMSQPVWMGKELSEAVNDGQKRMGIKSGF